MRIKAKLVALFIAVALIGVAPIAAIGLNNFEKQATKDIDSRLSLTLDSVVNQLDGWVMNNTKVVETIAFTLEEAVEEADLNADYLKAYSRDTNAGNISAIYIGLSDGRFIDASGWVPDSDYDHRKRPWYEGAKAAKKLVYSDPYLDQMTMSYAVSISIPLSSSKGEFIGVISEDILLSTITGMVKEVDLGGLGYAFLVDKNGVIIAHPDETMVNQNIKGKDELDSVWAAVQSQEAGKLESELKGENTLFAYKELPSTGWHLVSVVPEKLAYADFFAMRDQFILIMGILLVVVVALAYVIGVRFTKPLLGLKVTAEQMSQGDLTAQATVRGKDEIAELGTAFNRMSDNLRALLQQVASSAEHVNSISKETFDYADRTGKVTEQIAVTIEELAKGASEQADSVYSGAAMIEETSQFIARISENVDKTALMIDEANQAMLQGLGTVNHQVELAQENRESTDHVEETIQLLAEKSERIESIVEVIHSIAKQTNLLALNAAIEAARAGEHGKGFAVVAGEVRKLAEQSAVSAVQIAELLKDIQQAGLDSVKEVAITRQVVEKQEEAVSATKQSFEKIKGSIEGIVSQIYAVSSSTAQLSENASQVTHVMANVSAVVEESAAATEEVASSTQEQTASVQQISKLSGTLSQNAKELLDEVQKFKL